MLTGLLQLFSQLMVLKLYSDAVTVLILFIALEQIYSMQYIEASLNAFNHSLNTLSSWTCGKMVWSFC